MGSSLQFLTLLFPLFFLITTSNSMFLKVTKDPLSLQYLTHINKHTPPSDPIKLVVDLGGPFLWVDCDSSHVSSSHRLIRPTSLQCSMAKPNSRSCSSTNKTCDLTAVNSITRLKTRGELAEDILTVHHADHPDQIGLILTLTLTSITTVKNFLYVCAPPMLLNGLVSDAKGMLGLGKTRIALPLQLVEKAQADRIFFLCLSSSNGFIFFNDYGQNFPFGREVRGSLSYTPLISKQVGTLGDYYINLRSIKVNDRRISINSKLLSGGVKLSTVVPYTIMESSIYDTFIKSYVRAATTMNLTRVSPKTPFKACFGSKRVDGTVVGPTVPTIDFVLQSEMVKWRFHGRNSMVQMGDGVMCLGFLDGGLSASDAIVIGAYQLEDHLLEFDFGTSMLGFSSSLLMRQTSCSNFRFSTNDNDFV